MATRLTPNQKEARKQFTRIRNASRRLEKQGYIIPQQYENMQMPKRVTKAYLQELKSITPAYLREQSSKIVDYDTGLTLQGEELAEWEAGIRQGLAQNIIQNYRRELTLLRPDVGNRIWSWINDLIELKGVEAVATMLEKGAAEGLIIRITFNYNPEEVSLYMGNMSRLLPNIGKRQMQQIEGIIGTDRYTQQI